jgi:hypothetical protein
VDRLAHFLALSAGPEPADVTLRALTLFMLKHHAPRLSAERGLAPLLDAALEACAAVPYDFEEPLDGDRLQAGVDAWYLRHVAGLPHAPPDADRFADALRRLVDDDRLIYAWLLGELAAKCGLDVRVPLESARPFLHVSRLHDGYWLTHLVLLESDYLSRPVRHPQAAAWREALEQFVPWLLRKPNLDLAGEVALSLDALGGDASALKAQLAAAPPGNDAHEVATGLVALAGEPHAATRLWQKTRIDR